MTHRSTRLVPALAIVVLGLGGCKVDDGFLDEELFPCSAPADCGEGWSCVRASPYAADFCAPDCDATTCDGICVRQQENDVERELCLRGCRIRDDGTTSECPGEDFSCIRVSGESNDGVCYPVTGCAETGDCAEGEVCLSELADPVAGAVDADTDNLYCIPTPDEEGTCPARSIPIELTPGNDLCLATCDPPDTRCPPGSGCLQQVALAGPEADVPCFPGLHGVPCDDATNCLFGRCMDAGDAGRMCTITCDEAARLVGGCQNLLSIQYLSPVFEMECDPDANAGEGGGLCVTRYKVGFPCTTPESEAYACASGLECLSFETSDGEELRMCSKSCTTDAGCNDGGNDLNYCWIAGRLGGVCLPKGGDGARCGEDRHCRSGRCDDGTCTGDG